MSAVQITAAAWRAREARIECGLKSREYHEAVEEMVRLAQRADALKRRARRLVKVAIKVGSK